MGQTVDMLKIILGIEAKGFAGVQSQVKSLTESMQHSLANLRNAVAGYFTVSTAVQIAQSVTELGTRWEELSQNTGQSRQAVQQWDWAFTKVGKSIEHGISLFDQLEESRRKALFDPSEGGDKARFFFKRVGLSEEDVRSAERGAQLAIAMAKRNQPDDIKYRAAMVSEFGSQRTPWAIGAFNQMANGTPPPTASDESIKRLYDASVEFRQAVLEFKTLLMPAVAGILNALSTAFNFWKNPPRPGAREFASASPMLGPAYSAMVAMFQKLSPEMRKRLEEEFVRITKRTVLGPIVSSWYENGPELQTGPNGPAQVLAERNRAVTSAPTRRGAIEQMVNWKLENEEQFRMIRESFAQSAMQYGTWDQRKFAIRELMESKMGYAQRLRGLGESGKARTVEADVINLAGRAAEFEKITPQWNPDSLAKVGGYIGGAVAGIDPSLFYQRSMLEVQQQILMTVQGGAALLKALKNPQPSRPVAEDVQ